MPSRLSHLRPLATLVLLACAATRPLAAQIIPIPEEPEEGPSQSAQAAYLALTFTPVGALAPSSGYMLARPGASTRPIRLQARFAALDRAPAISQRTWAGSVDMPVMAATLGLTAGYVQGVCDDEIEDGGGFDVTIDCRGGLTLGAQLGAPLASRSLDAAGTSSLVVGGEVTAGYADIELAKVRFFGTSFDIGTKALSATLGVPIALVVHSGTVTVAPVITPRFGYGRATVDAGGLGGAEEETRAGGRFMLGAGVAVRMAERFGFDAGLQKVFIDEGETTFGLGLSFGF